MKKQLLTLFFIAGLYNSASAAVPAISDVAGTVQTGQTLTITGSNMVQEDTSGWRTSATAAGFEGSSPTSDGYSLMTDAPGGTYDTTVKLMGNKSMKNRIQGATTCPNQLSNYNYMPLSGDTWLRSYVRYNSTNNLWADNHIKLFDFQGNAGLSYYVQPSQGSSMPSQFLTEYAGSVNYYGNIPSGQLQNDRWYLVEIHAKPTSPTALDVWIDGVQVLHQTPPAVTFQYLHFGIVNACSTPSGFSLTNWLDGMVLSSSRVYGASVIEIGNGTTYKYQEPIYLSDGSVQIKADLTGLGSGPYKLRVTNNRQETSTEYTLGQGSVASIAAPTNLIAK